MKTTVSQVMSWRRPARSTVTERTLSFPCTATSLLLVSTGPDSSARPGRRNAAYASARGYRLTIATVAHPASRSVSTADQLTSSAPTMTARVPTRPWRRCTRFCS